MTTKLIEFEQKFTANTKNFGKGNTLHDFTKYSENRDVDDIC